MADYSFLAGGGGPLDQLSSIAQTQNQINQNKLFPIVRQQSLLNLQQTQANIGRIGAETTNLANQAAAFRAQQAGGALIVNSIDPKSGNIDFQRFGANLAAHPEVAPAAMNLLLQSTQIQGNQITNTQQVSNNIRNDYQAAVASGQDPNLVLMRGVQMGRYPMAAAAAFAGGTAVGGVSKQQLAKEAAVEVGTPAAMEAQFGTPESINTGGANVATTVNRVTGQRSALGGDAGAVPMTLTPEASAHRVNTVGPYGEPETVPQSAVVTPSGQPKPSPITGPQGQLTAGLSPAATGAQQVTGQGNANMAMQLTQRAAAVPNNKALLGNMDGLLDSFTPGPQSQFWKTLNQIATEYHLAPPGSAPQTKAQAQEEFGKLSFQLAQSQFQALGGTGTDSKLDSTMHTSPNELLTRYGNKGIIALLKGNEDAVAAQNDAWQKWKAAGHGAETYDRFLSQWNKIFDPRVFQSQYETPAERQTLLKGMTPAEQAKFKADYKRAVQLGWVK